jgi:signal peptidase
MRTIRLLGNVMLWIGALLGVAAGGVWVANQFGVVQPLIVISGSMEPNIGTGDLLIARPVPVDTVEVGDVLTLHSELTGKLVTHRVTQVTANNDDTWQIEMQGDANDEPDLESYVVDHDVLTPMVQIPGAGTAVSKVMEPGVALPILVALVALLGLSLLDEEPRRRIRRTISTVAGRNHRLDELDRDLAAVGVDVSRFEELDQPTDDLRRDAQLGPDVLLDLHADVQPDLDVALSAVGIDVAALEPAPSG